MVGHIGASRAWIGDRSLGFKALAFSQDLFLHHGVVSLPGFLRGGGRVGWGTLFGLKGRAT